MEALRQDLETWLPPGIRSLPVAVLFVSYQAQPDPFLLFCASASALRLCVESGSPDFQANQRQAACFPQINPL
jgi:hypothetical protein